MSTDSTTRADGADLATLAEGISAALGAAPRPGAPDAAWLEQLAREYRAATTSADEWRDRVELFASRLAPTLPERYVVYGAGDVGRTIADTCARHGRRPAAWVESDRPAAEGVVSGLPVWRPEEARAAGIGCVVLGTLASAEAMRARLATAYGAAFAELRVEAPPEAARSAGAALPPAIGRALDVVSRGRSLSEYIWLASHADERMDAALPINPDVRRLFHMDRYRFAAGHAGGRRVLDCASGTGYGSGWLGTHGRAAHVLGIEVDPEAVAYATRHYGSGRVEFRRGDACDLDELPDAAVDLVVSFETIEHVPDDRVMLAAFARVLDPSGRCIVSTPNDWPIETSPYHVRTYDRAAFTRVLSQHFGHVAILGQWPATAHRPGRIAPWTAEDDPPECLVAVCERPQTP